MEKKFQPAPEQQALMDAAAKITIDGKTPEALLSRGLLLIEGAMSLLKKSEENVYRVEEAAAHEILSVVDFEIFNLLATLRGEDPESTGFCLSPTI